MSGKREDFSAIIDETTRRGITVCLRNRDPAGENGIGSDRPGDEKRRFLPTYHRLRVSIAAARLHVGARQLFAQRRRSNDMPLRNREDFFSSPLRIAISLTRNARERAIHARGWEGRKYAFAIDIPIERRSKSGERPRVITARDPGGQRLNSVDKESIEALPRNSRRSL